MTRRELREHCFKLLFCTGFYPAEEAEEQMELYFGQPDEDECTPEGECELLHCPQLDVYDSGYVREKAAKVMGKAAELDQMIDEVAKGWTTRRMGRVELAILRLAVFEIRFDDDVPEKVAINEAVELAKKFGGSDSPAFINGILAKFV